ncbi:methyltransferase family protein [Mycobacterium tuberculosis]|nr:methyltransferase family protein [Mycobacterium tuberculosis]CNU11589.1 methyltransferase family protein [Mycobacterium tuberculosis]CNU87865.1 methyltransferase family protein [Mycobacterium tuberculosis]COV24347.1 methyltransferase family protein [Mycobacterium tuberculosis]
MAQATSGIRAALSQPAVYEAYQRIAGAKSGLAWITTDPIQSLPGMRTLDLGCWPAVIPAASVTATADLLEDAARRAR